MLQYETKSKSQKDTKTIDKVTKRDYNQSNKMKQAQKRGDLYGRKACLAV